MRRNKKGKRRDMRTLISKNDCERVLSGRVTEGEGLDDLVSAVRVLGRLGETAPSEDEVREFAAEAASSVLSGAQAGAEPGTARGIAIARSRRASKRRLRPALVATAAAVVLVVSGSAGVAYAADGAVPGDTLYGLDLALEKIGIGDGGLGERLTEASQLVARGRAQEGLDLAGTAILDSAPGDQTLLGVAEALRSAVEAAARDQGLHSPEDLDRISEKLRSMASGDKSAEKLGQAVEDLAGSLGQRADPGGSGGSGVPGNGSDQEQEDTPDETDTETEVDHQTPGPSGGSGTGESDSPGGDGEPPLT